MFQFYAPYFALLLPLPFLIRMLFPCRKKNKAPEIHFPALERLKNAFPSNSVKNSTGFFSFLLYLSWIFLVLALMQPEKVDQFNKVNNKGYDLMLALDISGSMQAVDLSTSSKIISRIDATKEVVSKFVRARDKDRLGLITFGQSAYLHVPLTPDTVAVSRMLNDIVIGMAGNGTAIGDAIGLAVRTLRTRPGDSKILVLLTDGEDNASSIPPIEAAKLAKQYGIRIYTVGIGKKGPVPFPTNFGGYALAETVMDEELLKQIAEMTGGAYFLATDKKALESIYTQIDVLEKTEVEHSIHFIREPLFAYPLSVSLLLLFILTFMRKMQYGT
jgi:Ca-activated chloride channel family protein